MMRQLQFAVAISLGALLVSACGGGGSTGGPPPTAPPTNAPTATPTPKPTATATPTPQPTATATPAPTPTPTPTATPLPGVLSVSPATLSLLGVGATYALPASVHDGGYTSAFTVVQTACAGIATVSPTTGLGPTLTLTVTGVAAGSCTATIGDIDGQQVPLAISVTTSNIGVNARHAQ